MVVVVVICSCMDGWMDGCRGSSLIFGRMDAWALSAVLWSNAPAPPRPFSLAPFHKTNLPPPPPKK